MFLDVIMDVVLVCVYMQKTLKSREIALDINRPEGIEDIWITVQCRKLPAIIVGCVYRHPKASTTSFDYIEESFKFLTIRKRSLFILGDFNDDLLLNDSKIKRLIKKKKLYTDSNNRPTNQGYLYIRNTS